MIITIRTILATQPLLGIRSSLLGFRLGRTNTYNKPVPKIAKTPNFLFRGKLRFHTVLMGSSKMAKSENVLITAEVSWAALSLMHLPAK